MDRLKDFRNISDEIMKDIEVSTGLKHKTLLRCRKKKSFKPAAGILAAAACVVLIIAVAGKLGWSGRNTSEISIMMESGQKTESAAAGDSAGMPQAPRESDAYGGPAIPEEAKKAFGEALLLPEFIPEGFTLNSINTSKDAAQSLNNIIFTYMRGRQEFKIEEGKAGPDKGFQDYQTVEINGSTGYVKSNGLGDENLHTVIHWSANGFDYSVTGRITENEAIEIAQSMK